MKIKESMISLWLSSSKQTSWIHSNQSTSTHIRVAVLRNIHPHSSVFEREGRCGGGAKASGTGLDWVGENEARFTRPGYRTARPGRVRTERAWLSQCSPSGEERVGAAGPVMWSSRPFLPSILEGNEKKVIFKVKFDKWWNIIIN